MCQLNYFTLGETDSKLISLFNFQLNCIKLFHILCENYAIQCSANCIKLFHPFYETNKRIILFNVHLNCIKLFHPFCERKKRMIIFNVQLNCIRLLYPWMKRQNGYSFQVWTKLLKQLNRFVNSVQRITANVWTCFMNIGETMKGSFYSAVSTTVCSTKCFFFFFNPFTALRQTAKG